MTCTAVGTDRGREVVGVGQRRDEFPNHFVGDLVRTERGWVVVPPRCCPDSHPYTDPGWSVSTVFCACNSRHMRWRCWKRAELRCATASFDLNAEDD
jgi:hypothetical protein